MLTYIGVEPFVKEATEGQWEKQIIDRIVTQHENQKPNLNRATPGRK